MAQRRFVLFTKNAVNPNYLAMRDGAARVAREAGVALDWRTTRAPDDPVEQTALLKQTLWERPDGIIFAPADDRAMDGPVREVQAAGIAIIGFVNRMPGRYVSFVGADDVAMGRMAARHLIGLIGGRGNVVLIEGPASAPTARDRGRGFREAIAEAPAVRLLGSLPGRYLEDGGYEAMRTHLAAHPSIDGVIATNDLMALGAARAAEEAGRRIPIIGNNGTLEAAKAIRDGRLAASMDYDGFKMGAATMMAMLRHLAGERLPAEILLPTTVIDQSNVAKWLVPASERPLPTWASLIADL